MTGPPPIVGPSPLTSPDRNRLIATRPAPPRAPAFESEQPLVLADNSLARPVLDIVVPVYNEAGDIERAVRRLRRHLDEQVPYASRITIADNASTDATAQIAVELVTQVSGLRVIHLDAKGRGRALKAAWSASDAQIVAYCDADLSTDLNALMPLIAPLISAHSDIAIGSRLARGSRVVRGPKREFISRSYNIILRTTMGAHFSDAQCGFKALRADVARHVLPYVADTGWFFDTELLVVGERLGLRIAEVPVDWIDDADSSVDILPTAIADLKGCARVAKAFARGEIPVTALQLAVGSQRSSGPAVVGVPPGLAGQLIRFCVVGIVCTAAYAGLYLALHGLIGAQAANFVALALTAVANTTINRRFSFGVRGRTNFVSHQVLGLAVFGFGWAITALALLTVSKWVPDASQHLELAALVSANLIATLTRFVGLRWVFRRSVGGTPITAGV